MKHACEKISQLSSDRLERKLTFKERVAMRFHFILCGACKQYQQNLYILHEVFHAKRRGVDEVTALPEAKRNMIKQVLQELSEHSK